MKRKELLMLKRLIRLWPFHNMYPIVADIYDYVKSYETVEIWSGVPYSDHLRLYNYEWLNKEKTLFFQVVKADPKNGTCVGDVMRAKFDRCLRLDDGWRYYGCP